MAGDLNQDLQARSYYGSEPTRSTLRASLAAARLTGTTADDRDPVWRQTAGRHASIDHLCVCDRLAARIERLPGAWPAGPDPDKSLSDHFGARVDVEP